jgi:putative ABC transport system ATP-binding protein
VNKSILLRARDLTKYYVRGSEDVHALDGVSFDIEAGEIVGLVGPSGSGKTTLLNLIAGWEFPDSGSIEMVGRKGDMSQRSWDEVAIVPQSLGLIEELSTEENVGAPMRFGSKGSSDRMDELIASLGLTELRDRLPVELSLGEQQRTAVARALAADPLLVLADEPTGHQDAVSTRMVMAVLRDAQKHGSACIVATHNREILRHMERVMEMRDGRLLASGAQERTGDSA